MTGWLTRVLKARLMGQYVREGSKAVLIRLSLERTIGPTPAFLDKS